MTERTEDKIKVDKLMRALAAPPEQERDSANEQEAKWNHERRRAVEKQRQENRLEWYRYHARLAEHHARLADEHRAKADALDPGDPGAVNDMNEGV